MSATEASAQRDQCSIVLGVDDSAFVDGLDFTLEYPRPRVIFFEEGVGGNPHCSVLRPGSAVSAEDDRNNETLTVSFIAPSGVSTPASLIRCVMFATREPDPSEFTVTVLRASSPDVAAVDPAPSVVIHGINCNGGGGSTTTTTTSTTSTTLFPPASSTTTTSTTTTSTTLEPQICRWRVDLDDAVDLRRLDFAVDYSSAGGFVPGEGGRAECRGLGTAPVAFGNNSGLSRVDVTAINANDFAGPGQIIECQIIPTHFVPGPEHFLVLDVEAQSPAQQAVDPPPSLSLHMVGCSGPTTTTTSTTTTTTTNTSTSTTTVTVTTTLPPVTTTTMGGGGGTTTTTVDGVTTTSTTSTTTTTLGGPLPPLCFLYISLDEFIELRRLDVTIDYSVAGGEVLDVDGAATCRGVSTAASVFVDNNRRSELEGAMLSLNGFTGPLELVRCEFRPVLYLPHPGHFAVTDVRAYFDLDAPPIFPSPSASVSRIDCPTVTTTTTLPVTTTTTTTTTTIPGGGDTTTTTTSTTTVTTTSTSTTTTTRFTGVPGCGDANGDGRVTVTDALLSLRAAVGAQPCDGGRCDTDSSGRITTSDSLRILKAAVGLFDDLRCPS